ncbi:hypothetical protein ASPZODRAFT_1322771 [Penicilliopsis zonata CBS 506.65]|uniref:Uncharacterized protein n=1 Tax=Penicilliopsis zonata CBS 506.65 TaxID=1073090 RepID=A0A1L9SP56_9EURO|nr:hypothetical protein ASPZODRAFT_1322771 [Penicilliopsis zonata CBS 506.65]OJJ48807.1 hypothetical protein ASPZODRAFT_1322771 [Penicilliopsis zonata CBS 506.65]
MIQPSDVPATDTATEQHRHHLGIHPIPYSLHSHYSFTYLQPYTLPVYIYCIPYPFYLSC